MNRVIRAAIALILAVSTLIPVAAPAAASYGTDPACMKRYASSSLTYAQKVDRCTINTTTVGKWGITQAASGYSGQHGFWGWAVGNITYSIVVKVWYTLYDNQCAPVGACGTHWVADNVLCYTDFAYVVTITIEQCRVDHYTWGDAAGVYYVENFGPVSEGQHSLLILADNQDLRRDTGSN